MKGVVDLNQSKVPVFLSFDNMGMAAAVGAGTASGPDDSEPGLAVGYPRVLGLLAGLGLRATFFVEGWNGLHHPDRVSGLAEQGHEVGLHGWVHEKWATLERDEARRRLIDGDRALGNAGVHPIGFRPPGGWFEPEDSALLTSLGYVYESSLDPTMEPGLGPEGLARVPCCMAGVDHYYLGDDTSEDDAAARLEKGWNDLLDSAIAGGRLVTFLAHPHISGVKPALFAALERVLTRVTSDDRLEPISGAVMAERLIAVGSASR